MKKALFFAMGLVSITALAQDYSGRVGINTDQPSAVMNIKSKDDTQSPKNLELENQSGTKLITVLNNGRVGINNSNPEHILDIKALNEDYFSNNIIFRTARGTLENNVGSSGMIFQRARNTVDTPQALGLGDVIGVNRFMGYNGNEYRFSAHITARVTASIGANGYTPTSLIFGVENAGATESLYKGDMILYHTGNVGIGLEDKNADNLGIAVLPKAPLEKLHINGAVKISTVYDSATISDNSVSPIPNGGAGTIIFQNGHFFGWTGNKWKQLDN